MFAVLLQLIQTDLFAVFFIISNGTFLDAAQFGQQAEDGVCGDGLAAAGFTDHAQGPAPLDVKADTADDLVGNKQNIERKKMEAVFTLIAAQAAAVVSKGTDACPVKKNCFFTETLCGMWATYDDLILKFGKSVLLALLTLVIAGICVRIAKKLILDPPQKIATVDESLYKVFFNIIRIVIWLLAVLVILPQKP